MLADRLVALSLSLLLLAGCSSGTAAPPPLPAAHDVAAGPAGSSAARAILGGIDASAAPRAARAFDREGDEDDGDMSRLHLPQVVACGNGTYATDCAVWSWARGSGGGTRGAGRSAQAVSVGNPPILNLCRDATQMPFDFTPAAPVVVAGPRTFSLSYAGTHAPPIVSFATRWWNVSLQGTFSGSSTTAPAVTLTPLLADGAARGWLVFFTWSWPADVLLVPYALNEIQLDAGSSPLAVPPGGSVTLRAFDCLGRPIAARRDGSGFGLGSAGGSTAFSSDANLSAPVFGGSRPSGFVQLRDDRGARTAAPVVAGSTAI